MGAAWCCFKFWFVWRLLMASLAHFNWAMAINVNCIYFILWKSYDLLWFWMHLLLCICFPALRSENYLLVWMNLIKHKRTRYPNKSYEKIFNILYNTRYTKSERALKRIETIERGGHKSRQLIDKDIDDEADNNFDDLDSSSDSDDAGPSGVYPRLRSNKEEPAMPRINVDRDKPPTNAKSRPENKALITPSNARDIEVDNTVNGSSKSGSTASKIKKLMPNFLSRSNNAPKTEAEKRMIEEQKQRLKEEKKEQKDMKKKMNLERKEELRRLATEERKRRSLAAAIDLLLTWLRLMTTFAMLVGNLHKTFMPKYFIAPDQDVYEHPDILMFFTITMSLDVMLFWFMMFWTYCQQCRLCCRLGLLKFWLWLVTLGFFGGVCMYYPMHYIHQELDPTWCVFMPGSDLSKYFDG
ncbi:hypothetical protein Ddc_07327 [Ditylenchus destructor]|nr:hypothetical protein Ddc_07327 [Ditylenchus destructor]